MTQLVVTLALAGLCGCGGIADGGGGGGGGGAPGGVAVTCTWTSACGGDVVGTWNLQVECLTGSPPPSASCPGETITTSSPSVYGTMTFDGSGNYSIDATVSALVDLTLPASCLPGMVDCQTLATQVKPQLPPGATITCSGSASSSCECMVQETLHSTAMGAYVASGGVLTETLVGGVPTKRSYCVQGNTLTIETQNKDGTVGLVVATR